MIQKPLSSDQGPSYSF